MKQWSSGNFSQRRKSEHSKIFRDLVSNVHMRMLGHASLKPDEQSRFGSEYMLFEFLDMVCLKSQSSDIFSSQARRSQQHLDKKPSFKFDARASSIVPCLHADRKC
jgi:hypothetical protein